MKILVTGHRGHGKTSFATALLKAYPSATACECPEFSPEMLERHDLFVGKLSSGALGQAVLQNTFDYIYWVDASDRLDDVSLDYGWSEIGEAIERSGSQTMLIRIDNNGSSPNNMYSEGVYSVHPNLRR